MPTLPVCVTPHNGPWPLFDAAASRLIEQTALQGRPAGELMQRAGLAVARLALASAPHADLVRVWAGPGNNGGDGLVAARLLHQAGLRVLVRLLADPARMPADAAAAHAAALQAGVAFEPADAAIGSEGLVIDALLGLGASRAPGGGLEQAIKTINRGSAPVLAVDLPSGLHPDTGQPIGDEAVRAQFTLSLLTLKPGCFTALGRDHAGTMWLDDLEVIATQAPTARLAGPQERSARAHAAHKGSQGDVAVVGGAPGMAGAAWLAGSAALAAGAGRVYCSLFDAHARAPRGELMTRPAWWQGAPTQISDTTVVCGCGGGDAVASVLPPLLAHAGRLVLDADALNAIAADPMLRQQLGRRGARGQPTLLTPHPLEAARLLASSTAQVQANRLQAAQQLAAAVGCTVLLKGSGSIIATPGEVPVVNSSGNAALATAGTGDVLAGWAGGLWAQAGPGTTGHAIAVAAAWQHGAAADRFALVRPAQALRALELIEALTALP